mgnify:CR=1 FL=1
MINALGPHDWSLDRSFKEAVSFDDVLLVPQYSDIESRSEVNINSDLDDNITLHLPVISSPMDTITELTMAKEMSRAGGLGIIHRYNTIQEQATMVQEAVVDLVDHPAAAIGVTGDYLKRAKALVTSGAEILCIDVAHGHHAMMKKALKELKAEFGHTVHIMAGNVGTLEGLNALAEWGADSVRCGIGGGSICSTRLVTGHGVPTLQNIIDCARSHHDVKIIADGGIKKSGDIVKALAAGADFVMVGSMFAGTTETPGQVFTSQSGKKYKVYRGMASKDAQTDWRGKSSTPEGISTTVPFRGSVKHVLRDITGGIKSGLSYTGARNLLELRTKAEFIKQTNAGQTESFTHILMRNK